ncbi:DNA-binding transcriptional regulator, AcrR family [Actinokineospora alba]|uniref:DNA-binding transcriptional regulator, AcrR family n=1 Tax=Actinokineospora alba TaxID=504798 RepID=A0A1H0VPT4_9PSEU|nr:TetR/AcrR family transcriptional regulator [Actinokineospora alba]TDP70188.1 TetR family transcriptional regulator [Actinokineospora alba]SDI37185.1 DNA-binding transcriptional regulator, AcrR family [Actinokineospora alba]SDP80354.1 DNA-binding transcriptional regulator, AcrR family [Actinokineospora alba]
MILSDRNLDLDQPEILDGALSAFLEFGIRRTSMGEVAKRSKLSPATLYRRFAQKSDIIRAVAIREARRFIDEVDARIDPGASAEEQVVEGFVAFTQGVRRNKLLTRLLVTEPEFTLPLLTTEAGPFLALGRDYLAGVTRRLQAEGKLGAYEPEPVAEILARLALSLVLTPDGVIPVDDVEKARAFARDHITALVRLA